MSGVIQTLLASVSSGPRGEQVYTTPGTYTWTVPAGVTSVCMVAIGGGGGPASNTNGANSTAFNGGGGGSLVYSNNVSVTPGANYTVVVGSGGGSGSNGSASTISGSGVSISAGGGSGTGGQGGTASGGSVNNRGGVATYTVTSGGSVFLANGDQPSYTYNETLTAPVAAAGGTNLGSQTMISGVNYGAFRDLSKTGASLDGSNGTTRYAGLGGGMNPGGTNNPPTGFSGGSGGVRIIWGSGRSYPTSAL